MPARSRPASRPRTRCSSSRAGRTTKRLSTIVAAIVLLRALDASPIPPQRGLAGCEQAVTESRADLAAAPSDPERQLPLADALACVIRIRTNGNALLVEGGSDTPEHRAIWKEMAPEAVRAARAARDARPDDPLAQATYTEAYMYDASSQGIVEAILKGAAGEYKRNAQTLIDRFPQYEDGAGYVFMGSFYFVAPWPMSDPKKGRALLDQALAVAPSSRRNLYFAGVAAYRTDDYARAAALFEQVPGGTCTTPNERDLCDFVTRESQRLTPIARAKAGPAESAR